MDEYISREALLAEIAADHGNWIFSNDTDELYRQGVEDNYSDTIRLINEIPVADVQPVKRGHWIDIHEYCKMTGYKPSGMGAYHWCSECEKAEMKISNYCPNCGVRMDGDAE